METIHEVIDLKSEDIFLNVNSICDEIIAEEEDFSKTTPQMSVGFWIRS